MNFFHKRGGRGGSTGFYISYSEIVILPKFVENLNKDFIKAVRGGGGGHRFMKVFHKIPVFFEGWFPLAKLAALHCSPVTDGPRQSLGRLLGGM